MKPYRLFRSLVADIDAFISADPAARNRLEVLLTYPGLRALWSHKVAHGLWRRGLKLPARILSERVRRSTGIEIHPAAVIGDQVVIDHGTGVVIGETARIGDRCVIYHGVTLGGRGLVDADGRRHPVVGESVLLGAGAIILGPVTIGAQARIGAGAVVTVDVADGATVTGNRAA